MKQSIKLASSLENINETDRIVDEIFKTNNFDEQLYGNVVVALSEAITNAIYHGNKCDSKKEIEVHYAIGNDSLMFEVSDKGTGFDYESLPDPTDESNISNEFGRGIFLLKSLSDRVEFENGGSTIKFAFKTS